MIAAVAARMFTGMLTMPAYVSRRMAAHAILNIGRKLASIIAVVIALSIGLPTAAAAQTANPTNTQTGTIDGTTTCAAGQSPLVRNFNVSNNFTVADVNIGILVTHTWRGDLQFTLQGPDGTRVQLTNGDTNAVNGDNFNVLLDDSAGTIVNTDGNTRNHRATAPPYQNIFRPRNPLSAFNGRAANGVWRLEICDLFPAQDNGQFVNATLNVTGPFADLSLTKTVSNAAPTFGSAISYTLTVSNASTSQVAAGGVQVRDNLPTGFQFTSASSAFNSATGIWTVGNVPVGASRSITINGTVSAGAGSTVGNVAEIIASSVGDPDSIVNNGSAAEDDYAARNFTVQGSRSAGIAPQVVCPKGAITFDWAGRTWPQGSTSNNYTLDGLGAFNWSIVSPAPFISIAALGGQQPALTNAAQNRTTLSKGINFANRQQFATTTITLGDVVDGAQFTIFDVDFAPNDFADRVRVFGRRGSATVIPVLTNGVANYVVGNEAFGDAPSAIESADGNVIVTFQQPVDTIIIEYGNHNLAPDVPDGQAIQMSGGISVCNPDGSLTVAKTSSVISDPVKGTDNPFNIPGATVRYCILVTNTGTASARAVAASDTLPARVTFVPGSIRSGTTCANAVTVEDDNATGPDESDPAGASFANGTVAYTNTSIAGGTTAAMVFNATVN